MGSWGSGLTQERSLPFHPSLTLGQLHATLRKFGSPGECMRSPLSINNKALSYVNSPKAPERAGPPGR